VRRAATRSNCRIVLAAGLVLFAGCRQDMYDQPRYESLEASRFFDDGMSARPLEPGTVARLDPRDQPRDLLYDASRLDEPAEDGRMPLRMSVELLRRGQERYRIYCTPCHGELGDGRGLIVERGFSAPPPFYGKRPKVANGPVTIYDDLHEAPDIHFFNVITDGHGAMYSYASRIAPRDRWAIVAYIRALQLSQHAREADLPARDRSKLAEVMP